MPSESRIALVLSYWLGLPWRCKLFGHQQVKQELFNENVLFIPEESWYECERCGHWCGYA